MKTAICRLIMRRGSPLGELNQLLQETRAEAILAEEDFTPYARRRDAQVARSLPLRLVGGTAVHHPATVLKADGTTYTVFTPFSKAWQERPFPTHLHPKPDHICTPAHITSLPIPQEPKLSRTVPFIPGEIEAQRRLRSFAENRIYDYAEARNWLDLAGTSQLSPYLHFGMVSAPMLLPTSAFSTLFYKAKNLILRANTSAAGCPNSQMFPTNTSTNQPPCLWLCKKEIGCIIGQQYPAPIIAHKQARQRTLDAYGKAKQ